MTSATILIIEDNEPTRKLLSAYLQKAGHSVIEASDGEDALEKLKTSKSDLILVDLQMEPVGGLRFMRRIIGTENEAPAILITGDPSADILNEANKLNMAGVIRKPVEETMLLKNIERVLTKYTRV